MRRDIALSLSPRESEFGPLFFSGNLDAGLRAAAALGFTCVELSLLDSTTLDQERLLDRLGELALRVCAIATGQTYLTDGYSLFHHDDSARAQCLLRLKRHCDLAARLGAGVIIGGIRGKLSKEAGVRSAQERRGKHALRECAAYAGEKGVRLFIEPVNRYETDIVNTLSEGLALISEIGLGNLKLLPDTFHMNIEEADPAIAIVSAGAAIGYVHCADSNRLAPGWGHFDFPAFFDALDAAGYRGPIGIEALPKPDDESAARQAIACIGGLAARRP
jgi:sugar phosphate isomerase/epimerase